MRPNDLIVVYVTWPTKKQADKALQILVKEKLVACAQIIQHISSYYFWNNAFVKDTECFSLLKTRHGLFKKLEKRIQKLHSYEVPEIIALPVIESSRQYKNWVRSVL